MFKQDYIMRLIHEMVRLVLKIVFHIDVTEPSMELLETKEDQAILEHLLKLADSGKICEAEDQLSELSESGDMAHLKIGLLFYSHINDMNDEYLESHNFSREEVKEGLETLLKKYNIYNLLELFLN